MNLDTQKIIDEIIVSAYNHMNEIFNINVDSTSDRIYQTFAVTKNNPSSYLHAYINYYMGVFEGLFITLFLEEFDAYPTPEEKEFIQNSFGEKWKKFLDKVAIHATKDFKKDLD